MTATIDPAALAAMLESYTLGPLERVLDNGLSVNSATCLFETSSGVYFAKRLAPADWQWPILEAEHRLSVALGEAGYPTPRLQRDRRGATLSRHGEFAYAISECARGEDRYRGVPVFASFASSAEAEAAGSMLARFHRALAPLQLPERPFRGLVARYELLRDPELRGLETLLAENPTLADFVARRPEWPALVARMAELARTIAPRLNACPRGVIHGDFIKRNLFWEDARIVDVVDFDLWNVGHWVFDLALALLPCGFDWPGLLAGRGEPRGAQLAAMLHGYASVRPLDRTERELLPLVMETARFEFYLSAIAAKPEQTELFWRLLDGTTRWFATHLGWSRVLQG
ncbi:MAG TPA: phosphotransferase [Oscillatoriaceae cyanobacterium]